MQNERLTYLFNKHFERASTPPEQEELMDLVMEPANEEALRGLIEATWDKPHTEFVQPDAQSDAIYKYIVNYQPTVHRIHFLKTAWFRYAAILLLIAGTATYLYITSQPSFRRNPEVLAHHGASKPQDIPAGGNHAILTLADGSTIALDSAANGNLANQGTTKIVKPENGKLAYQPGNASGEIGYNTISTPKGGLYQITLPDGTKAWLNAASSITFPTAFQKTREITATGEIYIEVAPDKTKPFLLKTGEDVIEVLGTSFNLNAYADDNTTKTTLVEGSIKVRTATTSVILKPGEQATTASTIKVTTANITQTLAWKNGLFNFENATLTQVMKQLERWYNITVKYEGPITDMKFKGQMNREVQLSTILFFLEKSGITTRLESNTLIVKTR